MRRRRAAVAVVLATATVGSFAAEPTVEGWGEAAVVALAGLALGGLVVLAVDGAARSLDDGAPDRRAVAVGVVAAAGVALAVVEPSIPFTLPGIAAAVGLAGAVAGWVAGTASFGGARAGGVACGVGTLAAVPVAAVHSFSMQPALTWMPIWVGLLGPAVGLTVGGVGGALGAHVRGLAG